MFALMESNRQKDIFIIPLLVLLCMTSGCYFNLIQRGLEYERRGDYRSAIESYERAANQTSAPKDKAIAQGQLGRIYARLGKYREAREFLQEAKKYLPKEAFNYADVCYALGLSYYEAGEHEWDRAAEEFEQAIEMYPKMPQEVEEALIKSHFYLWVIYFNQEKYALAQVHFQKAMMRDNDYAEPFFWEIPPAPSKEDIEKIPITVLPFSNDTGDESLDWLSHGIPAILELKFAAAESITLIDSAQLEEILKRHGISVSDLADSKKAIDIGKLIVAKKIVYGSYQKRLDDILTIIGKVTDVETGETEKVVERSGSQKNIRDLEEQIGDTLVLAIDANAQYNQASAQFMRGNAYVFRGMYNEAIQTFKKARQIMPNLAQIHNNLGNVYALSLSYEAAISEYTQALKLKPDWPEACYNLARAYSLNHDKTAAKEWLKKAMTLNQQYIRKALADPAFGDVEFRSLIRSQ